MSGKIRFEYKCKDIPEKIFLSYIPSDYTVEQVLEVIRKKRGNNYKFLFDDDAALFDNDDNIIDYWEQERIFIASLDDEPPEIIYLQGMPIPLKIPKPSPPKLWPPHKYAQTVGPTIDLLNTYYFYFTGSTKNHLSNGIQVNLDGSMNFEQCHAKLVELLRKQKVDVDDKRLFIFFLWRNSVCLWYIR